MDRFLKVAVFTGLAILVLILLFAHFDKIDQPCEHSNGSKNKSLQTGFQTQQDQNLTNDTGAIIQHDSNYSRQVQMDEGSYNNPLAYLINDLQISNISLKKKSLRTIGILLEGDEYPNNRINQSLIDALTELESDLDSYDDVDRRHMQSEINKIYWYVDLNNAIKNNLEFNYLIQSLERRVDWHLGPTKAIDRLVLKGDIASKSLLEYRLSVIETTNYDKRFHNQLTIGIKKIEIHMNMKDLSDTDKINYLQKFYFKEETSPEPVNYALKSWIIDEISAFNHCEADEALIKIMETEEKEPTHVMLRYKAQEILINSQKMPAEKGRIIIFD